MHLTLRGLQKRQYQLLGNICTVACIREKGVAIASATPPTNPANKLNPDTAPDNNGVLTAVRNRNAKRAFLNNKHLVL